MLATGCKIPNQIRRRRHPSYGPIDSDNNNAATLGATGLKPLAKLLLIEQGEQGVVRYFLVLSLLVGTGLAFGRATADALFLKRYGIEYLPAVYAVLGIALAVSSIAYASVADRIPSERTFRGLLWALAVLLIVCWYLMYRSETDNAYPFYYLIYKIASELLTVHILFHASQNLDVQQSKRLFPLVFGALQSGEIVGGLGVSFSAASLGMQNLILVWIALLSASIFWIEMRYRGHAVSVFFRPQPQRRGAMRHALSQINEGLRFARGSKLVRSSAAALFFLVISFYVLSYAVSRIYAATFSSEIALGSFLGTLGAATSGMALIIQFLFTNRLLRRFGLRNVNLIFPLTNVFSYGLLLAGFNLPNAILGSINKDGIMPAIRNPAYNLFFAVLPDYMQGRVRAMFVGFVLPMALVLAGTGLMWMQTGSNPQYFLIAGMVAGLGYLYFCVRMNRNYRAAVLETIHEKVFLPDTQLDAALRAGGAELLEELKRGSESQDPDLCVLTCLMLLDRYPSQAIPLVMARADDASPVLHDRLLEILGKTGDSAALQFCMRRLDVVAPDTAGKILHMLIDANHPGLARLAPALLNAEDCHRVAVGIEIVMRCAEPELRAHAGNALRGLLDGDSAADNLAGLTLLRRVPQDGYLPAIERLLQHGDDRVRSAALNALREAPIDDNTRLRLARSHLNDTAVEIRVACLRCLERAPVAKAEILARRLLEDPRPVVRKAALGLMFAVTDSHDRLIEFVRKNEGSPRAQASALDAILRFRPSQATLVTIIENKITNARRMIEWRHIVTSRAPLVSLVLEERIGQYLNLALHALEGLEDPRAIRLIRAGLDCGDPRQEAIAREALQSLGHRRLGEQLNQLLSQAREAPNRASGHEEHVQAVDALRAWSTRHHDLWLRDCVEFTVYLGNATVTANAKSL